MVKNIRVGIVGLGHISHRHMQIYKHINELAEKLGFRVEIAAVAEILPRRLKEWAVQYNIQDRDCYMDFHEMLSRKDIDYIDVCVHTNYHVPVTIECMQAFMAFLASLSNMTRQGSPSRAALMWMTQLTE